MACQPRPGTRRGLLLVIAALVAIGSVAVTLVEGFAADRSNEAIRASSTFWAALEVEGEDAEDYPTAREMLAASDLVIVGRPTSVEPGAEPPVPWNDSVLTITYAIERCVKVDARGCPTSLAVEFFLPAPERLVNLATAPVERDLLFLRDKEREIALFGVQERFRQYLRGRYRVVATEGLVREVDGVVVPPLSLEPLQAYAAGFASLESLEEVVGSITEPPR